MTYSHHYFDDPSCFEPCNPAGAKDPRVLQAVANLIRYAKANRKKVVCSPMVGGRYRILVMQYNNDYVVLLNPQILNADDFVFLLHETSPWCPGVSWPKWRPQKISISYNDLEGRLASLSASGDIATLVARNIEYLDGLFPFKMLTKAEQVISMHNLYSTAIPQNLKKIYEGYQKLRGAPSEKLCEYETSHGKYIFSWRSDSSLVCELISRGQAAEIKMLYTRDPFRITKSSDEFFLAALRQLPGNAHVSFLGYAMLSPLLSALPLDMSLDIESEEAAIVEMARLVLTPNSQELQNINFFNDPYEEYFPQRKNKLDGIFIDVSSNLDYLRGVFLDIDLLRKISKSLKSNGYIMIAEERKNGTSEDVTKALSTVFPWVYIASNCEFNIFVGSRSVWDFKNVISALYISPGCIFGEGCSNPSSWKIDKIARVS